MLSSEDSNLKINIIILSTENSDCKNKPMLLCYLLKIASVKTNMLSTEDSNCKNKQMLLCYLLKIAILKWMNIVMLFTEDSNTFFGSEKKK